MKPIVLKFGGTSVAGSTEIGQVASIVEPYTNSLPVVVVSAAAGVTDALLEAVEKASLGYAQEAVEIFDAQIRRYLAIVEELVASKKQPLLSGQIVNQIESKALSARSSLLDTKMLLKYPKKMTDEVVSLGDMLSAIVVAEVFKAYGIAARSVDARHCIITNDCFTAAEPILTETLPATEKRLKPLLLKGLVPVLAGFVGSTLLGATTTLGRGGSDYTASLVGEALDAREVQIWTDVSGIKSADPRLVPDAQTVPLMTYEEAATLARFGAKVLHPKSVAPAHRHSIPLTVRNSFEPEGRFTTLVKKDKKVGCVKAVSLQKDFQQDSLIAVVGERISENRVVKERLEELLAGELFYYLQETGAAFIGLVVKKDRAVTLLRRIEKELCRESSQSCFSRDFLRRSSSFKKLA